MKFVQLQRPLDWNYQTATVGPVADSTALSALTGYIHRDVCLVEDIGLFRFEAYSIQAEVAGDVIAPDDIVPPAPGRWVRFSANADSDLTAFANVVGQTIHVDGANGDDLNPGTEVLPVKTLARAVALAALIDQTSTRVTIRIADGTYDEDLVLENVALKNLAIIANTVGGVTVNALSSTTLNQNLAYLYIEGIKFLTASTLSCDVTGVASLLCSTSSFIAPFGRSTLSQCSFASGLTISTVKYLYLKQTRIDNGFVLTNSGYVYLCGGTGASIGSHASNTIKWDETANKPNGVTSTNFYGLEGQISGVTGFSIKTLNTTSIKANCFLGTGEGGFLGVYGAYAVGPYGKLSVGANCRIIFGPGASVDATSLLDLGGGDLQVQNSGDLTLASGVVISWAGGSKAWSTRLGNDHPTITTEVVDAFPFRIAGGAIWDYRLQNSDGSLKIGTLTIGWDSNGTLTDVYDMVKCSAGTLGTISLVITQVSDEIRLSRITTATGWFVDLVRTWISIQN